MSYIIFSLILIQTSLFAYTSFKGENISLNYEQQQGVARLGALALKTKDSTLSLNDHHFNIQSKEKILLIDNPNLELKIEDFDNNVVSEFKKIKIDVETIASKSNKYLRLKSKTGIIQLKRSSASFENISIDCNDSSRTDFDFISFIRPCFVEGEIRAEKINSENFDNFVQKKFPELSIHAKNQKTSISGFEFLVKDSKYSLKTFIKYFFKFKIIVNGAISYDEKTRTILSTIEKAKLGPFGIKKMVLNFIKKEELRNVTVDGDSISIKVE